MKLEIVFKDGRKQTFDNVESFNVKEEQIPEEFRTPKVARIPTEGKMFEVNPLGIDRSEFEKPMSDRQQEATRKMIQEAFTEVDKHPIRYASKFYTFIPLVSKEYWKDSIDKSCSELEAYATDIGGQMADWVEQALEWAQRINNGESWEDVCNNADRIRWYRVVLGKFNHCWRIGGVPRTLYELAPSNVEYDPYRPAYKFTHAVPLVTFRF